MCLMLYVGIHKPDKMCRSSLDLDLCTQGYDHDETLNLLKAHITERIHMLAKSYDIIMMMIKN